MPGSELPGRAPRARRWPVVGGLLLLGLALVGGLTAARLARASRDLRAAQDLVESAATAIQDGRLADARSDLGVAQTLVLRTNNGLYTVSLQLVASVPAIGDNVESLRDSVGLAASVIGGGRQILEKAIPLESPRGRLEVSLSDGSIPLEAVSGVQREVTALAAQLPAEAPTARSRWVLSSVKTLHTAVYEEAASRRDQLDVLGHGLRLLQQLAGGDGPRRYLIAVANSAEMRGSGGMILNYGVLEGRDGVIDLTAFGRIDELALPGPVASELVPSDYLERWNGFDPLSRWRQANLSGDFTVVAPVLEAMYSASSGLPVDGVIQIDPAGLAALLDGVGPVLVPELGEVRGDNVVALTLNEAYIAFPDIEERSDVLGDVAEAALRRLVDGDIPSLRTLATRLAEAVDARHLLMHATSSGAQNELLSFGADGAYPDPTDGDVVALTAQNLAGNKLDYYLDTHLDITGTRKAGELGDLEARVTLSNTAPADVTRPRYIFGPFPGATTLPAGVLRSLVTLYLPTGTTLEDVGGDLPVEPVSSGTEDGRPYVAFIVDVPAGQARSLDLSLRLAPRPAGPYRLDLIPSPRVRPTTVRVEIGTGAGTVAGDVELDRRWQFADGEQPVAVSAPAFR